MPVFSQPLTALQKFIDLIITPTLVDHCANFLINAPFVSKGQYGYFKF